MTERLVAALIEHEPWVRFLPADDQEAFVTEVTETVRACASIGRYTALVNLMDEWRTTAEIWSDPELAAALAADVPAPLDLPA